MNTCPYIWRWGQRKIWRECEQPEEGRNCPPTERKQTLAPGIINFLESNNQFRVTFKLKKEENLYPKYLGKNKMIWCKLQEPLIIGERRHPCSNSSRERWERNWHPKMNWNWSAGIFGKRLVTSSRLSARNRRGFIEYIRVLDETLPLNSFWLLTTHRLNVSIISWVEPIWTLNLHCKKQ